MTISSDLINISSSPFPKQILDPSKLKEFADDDFKLRKLAESFQNG